MKKAAYQLVILFLLMTLSFILSTACYQSISQQGQPSTTDLRSSTDCKIVQHKLGKTCIPSYPKRIIILDEFYLLDAISVLGIKPVGFAACFDCVSSDTLSEFIVDVPNVGAMETPSVEKILDLKPDLILGLVWQEKSYSLLSKIAPTVIIEEPETAMGFKEMLEYLAEILDRTDLVEEILAEYESKIQSFQKQLGEQLKARTVSVIGIEGSSFFVDNPERRFYGQVMVDAGIQFTPAQEGIERERYGPVSIETLPDWDADFLFVLQNYERHAEDLASMMEHPIWSTLSAVQSGKVHPIVLDVWGPLTAIHFIDDLYQYFANEL